MNKRPDIPADPVESFRREVDDKIHRQGLDTDVQALSRIWVRETAPTKYSYNLARPAHHSVPPGHRRAQSGRFSAGTRPPVCLQRDHAQSRTARCPQQLLDGHGAARPGARHALVPAMTERGISVWPFFYPLSAIPAYRGHPSAAGARERNPVAP
jgi:hypothetical protein